MSEDEIKLYWQELVGCKNRIAELESVLKEHLKSHIFIGEHMRTMEKELLFESFDNMIRNQLKKLLGENYSGGIKGNRDESRDSMASQNDSKPERKKDGWRLKPNFEYKIQLFDPERLFIIRSRNKLPEGQYTINIEKWEEWM